MPILFQALDFGFQICTNLLGVFADLVPNAIGGFLSQQNTPASRIVSLLAGPFGTLAVYTDGICAFSNGRLPSISSSESREWMHGLFACDLCAAPAAQGHVHVRRRLPVHPGFADFVLSKVFRHNSRRICGPGSSPHRHSHGLYGWLMRRS